MIAPDRPIGEMFSGGAKQLILANKQGFTLTNRHRILSQKVGRDTTNTSVEVADSLQELNDVPADLISEIRNFKAGELLDHIIEKHHELMRLKLPAIESMCDRFAMDHGEQCPYALTFLHAFQDFRLALEEHMVKEEHVLFPRIRLLEMIFRATSAVSESNIERADKLVAAVEEEHRGAKELISRIKEIADVSSTDSSDVRIRWQSVLDEFQDLVRDLCIHMAKEKYLVHDLASLAKNQERTSRLSRSRISAVLRRAGWYEDGPC